MSLSWDLMSPGVEFSFYLPDDSNRAISGTLGWVPRLLREVDFVTQWSLFPLL